MSSHALHWRPGFRRFLGGCSHLDIKTCGAIEMPELREPAGKKWEKKKIAREVGKKLGIYARNMCKIFSWRDNVPCWWMMMKDWRKISKLQGVVQYGQKCGQDFF